MQGPVNSVLKLAEFLILSADNIHATFLTTDVVCHKLIVSARAKEHFDRNPRFSFCTFSDGLPNDHPRGGDKFLEMLDAVKAVSHPIVREMLSSGDTHTSRTEANQTLEVVLVPPVTCIVSDGLYNFALDVGNEVGIPVFYFETMSPCCLWVYLCLPKFVEAGEVPFTGLGNERCTSREYSPKKRKGISDYSIGSSSGSENGSDSHIDRSTARWQMARVSNSPPTFEEYNEWRREVDRTVGRMPHSIEVLEKQEAINKINSFVY